MEELLTIREEQTLCWALYDQITYDRRQAACMIDAMVEQLGNSHLTVDYKIFLSRRVLAARRKWYREIVLDVENFTFRKLLRIACQTHRWSERLSELFLTNARMIRDRMSRIREINYNRNRLRWCL